LSQIVAGSVLVLIGIAWLLEATDALDIPWRALLAGVLVIVGAALMVGARTGRHGGLIALGVGLTLVLALSTAIEVLTDIPISGGIGEERHRPTTTVEDEYRWSLGSMTIDLRDTEVALAGRTIEASVVIGELVVIVPPDVAVTVDARSGVGEVIVFRDRSTGLGADLTRSDTAPKPHLELDLDVALGKVEVRR
jgi:predicted membrane protein